MNAVHIRAGQCWSFVALFFGCVVLSCSDGDDAAQKDESSAADAGGDPGSDAGLGDGEPGATDGGSSMVGDTDAATGAAPDDAGDDPEDPGDDEAPGADASDEAGAASQQPDGNEDAGSPEEPDGGAEVPPGGVCLEPAEIGLDDWEAECVMPTPVDVTCEMTATATGPNGTNVGTYGLDLQGHAVVAPILPPTNATLQGGTSVTLLSDDLSPVLIEMITPEGCVERREETFPTETGTLRVQTNTASFSCQVTESSDTLLRRYGSNRRCTCDEQNIEFEQQFGEDGELLASYDSTGYGYGWTYYEYEDGKLVGVVDEEGNGSSYHYDSEGRVFAVCEYGVTPSDFAQALELECATTEYADDGAVSERYPRANAAATIVRTTSTEDGLPLSITITEEGDDTPSQTTVIERDERGWITSYSTSSDSGVFVVEYSYTDDDQLESFARYQDDELQIIEEFYYDDSGRFTGRAMRPAGAPEDDCVIELSYSSDDCNLTLPPHDFTTDPIITAPYIYTCE